MAQTSEPLKVFFHSLDEIGHINACIGMAQSLAKRGHRITFIQNDSFAGMFSKLGFEEILFKQAPKQQAPTGESTSNPVKDMASLKQKSGHLGPKTPLEKLRVQVKQDGFNHQLFDKVMRYNSLVGDSIEREKPDLLILDSFMVLPSIKQANIPWILLFSGNPILLYQSEKIPPYGSGYAAASDPESWKEYNELMNVGLVKFRKFKNNIYEQFKIELSEKEKNRNTIFELSPFLNIYGYPTELDYTDIVPQPANLAQVDAFCRDVSEEAFKVPDKLNVKPGDKLIYLSLGSMGSIDVDLMKRIVSVLGQTPHKYIVSKGQRGDEYELPANCWGMNFLPQTAILPLVDLVITHGGNNTICETLSYGKPMIVMPLFGDQPDNAQRVHEKGYGVRVEPYHFTECELIETINRVLNDDQLPSKVKAVAERMAKSKSKETVVDQLEQIAAKFLNQHKDV